MSPMQRERYPAEWDAMRERALEAADHRCQGCGCAHREDGTTSTHLTVHHPDRDPENPDARLTVLCARCHLSVEPHARRRQRIDETRLDGETMAEAWHRAQHGILNGQIAMEDHHA